MAHAALGTAKKDPFADAIWHIEMRLKIINSRLVNHELYLLHTLLLLRRFTRQCRGERLIFKPHHRPKNEAGTNTCASSKSE